MSLAEFEAQFGISVSMGDIAKHNMNPLEITDEKGDKLIDQVSDEVRERIKKVCAFFENMEPPARISR